LVSVIEQIDPEVARVLPELDYPAERGRQTLEGVERTYVLVPVAALSLLTGAVAMAHGVECKALADFTADAQLPEDGGELAARSMYISRVDVLRAALDAAASGERAEWPS
jgi:hypothetical protein